MLRIETFICNPFSEQCYIAWDETSRLAFVVDPGMGSDYEWQRVHRFIEENSLSVQFVLQTHGHTDHCMGSAYVARTYNIHIYGSMDEQSHMPSLQIQNNAFGIDLPLHWLPIDKNLMDGDVLWLGEPEGEGSHRIEVLDCPGHSFHGLCFYLPQDHVLFSGDVLFCGSVGRSDFGPLMGGNGPLLLRSIVEKLLPLPADTTVYPGHGPTTTIGYESTYNPYF